MVKEPPSLMWLWLMDKQTENKKEMSEECRAFDL